MPGAFAVNRLRTRDDDFLDRQILFANDFEHLRGAERIDVHVFRDLGHVTAVSRLVKDDVDLVERRRDRLAIAHVAFDKLRGGIDPRRFAAAMRVRLEIIQDANFPAFANEKIGQVRTD